MVAVKIIQQFFDFTIVALMTSRNIANLMTWSGVCNMIELLIVIDQIPSEERKPGDKVTREMRPYTLSGASENCNQL